MEQAKFLEMKRAWAALQEHDDAATNFRCISNLNIYLKGCGEDYVDKFHDDLVNYARHLLATRRMFLVQKVLDAGIAPGDWMTNPNPPKGVVNIKD